VSVFFALFIAKGACACTWVQFFTVFFTACGFLRGRRTSRPMRGVADSCYFPSCFRDIPRDAWKVLFINFFSEFKIRAAIWF
jgi:hypothetical protein